MPQLGSEAIHLLASCVHGTERWVIQTIWDGIFEVVEDDWGDDALDAEPANLQHTKPKTRHAAGKPTQNARVQGTTQPFSCSMMCMAHKGCQPIQAIYVYALQHIYRFARSCAL